MTPVYYAVRLEWTDGDHIGRMTQWVCAKSPDDAIPQAVDCLAALGMGRDARVLSVKRVSELYSGMGE